MNTQPTSEQSIKGKYVFGAFPLYEHKTPVFKQNKRTHIVDFGDDNDYPDYLSYLYNRSSTHSAIVNGKCTYIFGKGWHIKEGYDTEARAKAQRMFESINSKQNLDELSQQIIPDWIVYGGYYLIVTKLAGEIISIKHEPFNRVRTNADLSRFYCSGEWTAEMSTDPQFRNYRGKMPKDVVEYPAFDELSQNGKSIFFHRDFRPAMKVYPLPEYEATIAAIETQIELQNYDLNNVKSGFSAGTMLTLFGGEPAEDEKSDVERQLRDKVTGTDNAGEIIINFQNANVPEPKVLNFRAENIADQFELLDPRIQQDIITGHKVTSGMLFGIKEQGQLGGRNELKTAWELFYNTYVRPKQIEFEKTINYFARFWGLPAIFELTQLEPIGLEINIDVIEKALEPDEFKDYLREKIGLKPRANQQQFKKNDPILHKLTSTLGKPKHLFSIVMEGDGYSFDVAGLREDENKVLDYLKTKPNVAIATMAEALKIKEGRLLQIIENLQKGNLIGATYTEKNGVVSVETEVNETDAKPQEGVKIVTMWEYAWNNPDDAKTVDKSRDFCKTMLATPKLYTRNEIDSLENDMEEYNTSVWRYRGGWYHNPETKVNLPMCRHYWKSVLVKEKI
jgi:hypothetical protein